MNNKAAHSITRFFFFFFKEEAGIGDLTVTGVQTCALPISSRWGDSGRVKANARLRIPGVKLKDFRSGTSIRHGRCSSRYLRRRRCIEQARFSTAWLVDRKSVV